MMSKLIALACLSVVATAEKATKQESYVNSVHDDKWCHSHHLGVGATQCIENNGCCFSSEVDESFQLMKVADKRKLEFGPCHSCDSHLDGWCAQWGKPDPSGKGNVWDNCVAKSGCTYTEERGCFSSADVPLVTEHDCEAYALDPEGKLDTYNQCIADAQKVEEAFNNFVCTTDNGLNGFETEVECTEDWDKTTSPFYRLFIKSTKQKITHDGFTFDGKEEFTGCKELYWYAPVCDAEDPSLFAPTQKDSIPNKESVYLKGGEKIGQNFCVDPYGHEIPDSRKQFPLDMPGINIDCVEWRKKANGYQCPNAMTLTTAGGVVVVNEDNNALDCTNYCNTDADCLVENYLGETVRQDWCCFNGCGYTCQTPVHPYSGCAAVPTNHPGQTVHAYDDIDTKFKDREHIAHKMKIQVSCLPGFDVMPLSEPQVAVLSCSHGRWLGDMDNGEFKLPCQQQCSPFDIAETPRSMIDGLKMRKQDFVIEGDENHYSNTRTLSCVDNYGVVSGSEDALATGTEVLTCHGASGWLNADMQPRSLECSVCYDDPDFQHSVTNNKCVYYQSRIRECEPGEGDDPNVLTEQQEACRVACRTCRQMEAKFGKKEIRTKLEFAESVPAGNQDKWKAIRTRIKVSKIMIEEDKTVVQKVRQIPLTEACSNGSNTKRATKNADTLEFECEKGYKLMG